MQAVPQEIDVELFDLWGSWTLMSTLKLNLEQTRKTVAPEYFCELCRSASMYVCVFPLQCKMNSVQREDEQGSEPQLDWSG